MQAGTRRDEVMMHARAVIVRDGLDATSLRRIARAGGFTTGVLTHHFADKGDLIAACFQWTMADWLDRVEADILRAPSAAESLCRFVAIAVPHDSERHGEWRLWLNFVTRAARDPQLADLLVEVDRRWDAIVAEALGRWRTAGLVEPQIPEVQQAAILARLGDGLGLRALVTGDWDEARSSFVAALVAMGLSGNLAEQALAPPAAHGAEP